MNNVFKSSNLSRILADSPAKFESPHNAYLKGLIQMHT